MPRNHIITGLDIGSSSIKSLVVSLSHEKSQLEILSQISKPSSGVRKGSVINPDKVSEIVSSVLKESEQECGQKIKEVVINIGGSHIFSTNSHGVVIVSRADQEISKQDIDRVIKAAQTFSLPPNREILRVFPNEFIVDGEKGIKQPLGMGGVRLEAEILVLGYFVPYFKNLTKAILDADVKITDIICNPLASAKSVLTSKEKELGVLLLDIGAGTTDFCVFKEGVLLDAGVIPIGSFNITKDIAIGLETDIDTAERIKIQYGSCSLNQSKKIKIKEVVSGETISFSEKELGKIIEIRVAQIFQQVQKVLKKSSCPKLPGGVVLCGGGAKLRFLKEFSKKNLKMVSRIGHALGFFPKESDSGLSCVSGLALEGRDFIEDDDNSLSAGFWQKIKKIFKSFIP